MRTHDFVSDGFLAVTAAGFVLLCSSLLAIASIPDGPLIARSSLELLFSRYLPMSLNAAAVMYR